MPVTSKPITAKLTTNAATTIYTCPASTRATVSLVFLANISATNLETVEVSIRRSGDATDFFLNKGLTIAAGSTQQIPGPLSLSAGDTLRVKSGNANTIDVVGSVFERT